MDLNSPLFDSIRIRRTCDEPKTARARSAQGNGADGKPAGTCEAEGCTHAGLYRAPKGRRAEGQYWNFCIDHVKAYNATYNYFDGMNDDAVQAFQKDAIIGHRPTWAMGVNRPASAKAADAPPRDWAYVDPLGVLRAEGVGGTRGRTKPAEPARPKLSATVRKALDVLGLEEGADTAAIKAQYKALVKRFHPDANGGDRSFEERLRDIIRAHDILRAAGLC